MKVLRLSIIAVLLLVWATAPGYAAAESGTPPEAAAQAKEDERVPVKKEEWQVFIAPYMWIPGVNINTTFLGHTSSANVGWFNVVPHLFSNAIGAMGRFEAWKGKWGIYVDSYFVYVGDSVSDSAGKTIDLGQKLHLNIPLKLVLNGDLKFISRAVNVDFGPRYLVGTVPLSSDKPLPLLSFEVLGGGRYNFYNQYLKLNLATTLVGPLQTLNGGRSFVSKVDRSFLEPFLGWRAGLWITPKITALLRFTAGGFGLAQDNNFDMDMELDLGYKVHKNIYAYAGWRARYVQFSATDLALKAWVNGPVLGAVFAF